ncbi:YggS family pyridoxal phosphate-dependent enzyme [Ferrovibrio sp.]|uniref:YggS family pyridoxal phosphate-dependent enzyme n=1 Tax=Ferrovibrio sp. TaxID=1917215 RepID=UPI0025C0667D|nr:YggS family pyridoxal phosphate-dependent enzyme [Ferrovibrio sp.]MBX3453052.1 YggS family pyridoxal phosphate-dependent enzyme [Ferrovibrio sp.]
MTDTHQKSIADALAEIRSRIGQANLIAVAKTFPAEAVAEAIAAGQRHFGENRVQEGMAKYPALRAAHPDLVLHLIGPLQTNKVRQAVAHFDVIHTLDRASLAEELAKEFAKTGRRLPCYIQVNTGEEPQKAGCAPQDADGFIAECRDRLGLPVVGLMCIPPADEEPAPHFALLAKIAKRNGLERLSMGMSGDYETAVEFGATDIRVGSAIFGGRSYPVIPG